LPVAAFYALCYISIEADGGFSEDNGVPERSGLSAPGFFIGP